MRKREEKRRKERSNFVLYLLLAVILILFIVFIVVYSLPKSILPSAPEGYNTVEISACQELNQSNTVYSLIQDIDYTSNYGYSMKSCFNITANNIILEGNNHLINLSNCDTNCIIVSVQSKTGIIVQDLVANTPYRGGSTISFNSASGIIRNNIILLGMISASSSSVQIINNTITSSSYGSNGKAIQLSSSPNSNITDNNISTGVSSNGQSGIYIDKSGNINIENNVISGGISSNNNYGIYLQSSNSNTINNNYINSWQSSGNYGIYLQSSNSNIINSNMLRGDISLQNSNSNNIINNKNDNTRYSRGFSVSLYNSTSNVIDNNMLSSVSGNLANDNTISNNMINSSKSSTGSAISYTNSRRVSITNNIISGGLLFTGLTGSNMSGNTFLGSQTPGLPTIYLSNSSFNRMEYNNFNSSSISLRENSNNNVINYNTVDNSAENNQYGSFLSIDNSSSNSITRNNINSNSGISVSKISFNNANDNQIIENKFVCKSDCITLELATKTTISNNNIFSGGYGINIVSSDNNIITNNLINTNSTGLGNSQYSYSSPGIYVDRSSANTIVSNRLNSGLSVSNSGDAEEEANSLLNVFFNNIFNGSVSIIGSYISLSTDKTLITSNMQTVGDRYLGGAYSISNVNIVGGSYLGGNYWTGGNFLTNTPSNGAGGENPAAIAIGFSDNCTDANKDEICDSSYHPAGDSNSDGHKNIDLLPLSKPPCTPDNCTSLGKQCGSWNDGCGGTLICGNNGNCSSGACNSVGRCLDICLSGTTRCSDGTCKTDCLCISNCSGKLCGSDGCGGSCGNCSGGQNCLNNICVKTNTSGCIDTCESLGYQCDSVCGNPCGTCGNGSSCESGICNIKETPKKGSIISFIIFGLLLLIIAVTIIVIFLIIKKNREKQNIENSEIFLDKKN